MAEGQALKGVAHIAGEKIYCEKCRKTISEKSFYTYKDGSKVALCKNCLSMHVDNFDPATYVWILEKMDVPYIPEEWNVLRDRAYAKGPEKMTSLSVLGKYLSKMKLKQWSDYGWEDTERLQKESAEKIKLVKGKNEASLKAQMEEVQKSFENGEISEAEYRTYVSHYDVKQQENPYHLEMPEPAEVPGYVKVDIGNVEDSLTEEDKTYLYLKWGPQYKAQEWLVLESKYNEMMESFDIQDADTIDTLKLCCKTSLKMHDAIDCGDTDTFQKLSRVYDSLRKSAKFTASQNKDAKGNAADSVGVLIALCEKEGFIPRFATDIPQDKVDKTLEDMNMYVYNLVTKEMGLEKRIEESIKKIEIEREREEDELTEDEEDERTVLEDADYEDFFEEMEQAKDSDMKAIANKAGE